MAEHLRLSNTTHGSHSSPGRDLAAEVDALAARVLALEAAAARHRRGLSHADRVALEKILPALGGVLGSSTFLASEAVQLDVVRLVIPGWSARRVGKLLRRAEAVTVDGYVVERIGIEAGAVLWAVKGVPEFHNSGNSETALCSQRGGRESVQR